MSEEDTFMALKSVPLSLMTEIWEENDHIPNPACPWTLNSPTPADVEDIFRKYGWTYKRYLNAYYPISEWPSVSWRVV